MKTASAPRSLRGRVALVATLTVASVLVLVGVVTLTSFSARERDRVDEDLTARPAPDVARALGAPDGGRPGAGPGVDGGGPGPGSAQPFGPPALRAGDEFVRLITNGQAVRGVDVPDGLPVTTTVGLRTVEAGGSKFRTLTREVAPGILVEFGVDLGQSEARITELRNRLLLIGLAGVLLVAAFSWWLSGLALRPLARLRDAAGKVSSTDDLSTRVDPGAGPVEIEQLTASINAMLARLETSAAATEEALSATRRFAGDAGHELRTPMTALQANLGAIRRNPDLGPDERAAALEGMERDAERLMRMLGTLQTLARGDSATTLPREPVEMTALAGGAAESARRRHPEITWRVEIPSNEVEATGWPDGLRAMVDNLLENAARHGRPDGAVTLTLTAEGESVSITVDDDGPGIPPDQRDRIFERFERGDAAGAEGSGLGLSLVRQQAKLHGGDVEAGESESGGARFRATIEAH